MNKTERIFKIEQLISARRLLSFQQLLDETEVSPATLKRDLEYLRSRMKAPIVYDRDANGYCFSSEGRAVERVEFPGLWFNASEAAALLTMEHLLEELQPGLLKRHIEPLKERLKALLESTDHSHDEIQRRVRILHQGRRAPLNKFFETIANALLNRRQIGIGYYARGSNSSSERVLSPQRLVCYRESWYLDAWCHLREEIRSFAVDAIRRAEHIDKKARDIAKRELDEVLGAGYGIFSGAVVAWARLRFTPQHARWVSAEQWHPQQKSHTEPDGHFVLELPYSNPTELVMDILRHGSGVEVLEPPPLRAAVRQELLKAGAAYGE